MSTDLVFDDYRPGCAAAIVALHMAYYAPAWGFGRPFEAMVAGELGAFLGRYDPDTDLFLNAYGADGTLLGSITIDGGDGDVAQLRWFIVAAEARGGGLGGVLMHRALGFCRKKQFSRVYLTTFAGLDAARALYERAGFVLIEDTPADPWSGTVGLQRFEITSDTLANLVDFAPEEKPK